MKYLLVLCLALVASNPLMAQCQNDQTPPLLAPKTNLTVALGGARCLAEVQPTFLLESYSDNCAPAGSIEVRARRLGEGSGFPITPNGASLTLTPADLPGPVLAEVWARDTSGNTAYTFVSVQLTNPAGCTFALLPDTLQAGVGLENFTWAMKTVAGPTADTVYFSGGGNLPLEADLLAGANQENEITIWPMKDEDPRLFCFDVSTAKEARTTAFSLPCGPSAAVLGALGLVTSQPAFREALRVLAEDQT